MSDGLKNNDAGKGSEDSPIYVENPSEEESTIDQQVLDLINGESILDLKLMEDSDKDASTRSDDLNQAENEPILGETEPETLSLSDLLETTTLTQESQAVSEFLNGTEPIAEPLKVADALAELQESPLSITETDFDAAFANAQFTISYDIDAVDPLLDDSNLSVSDS